MYIGVFALKKWGVYESNLVCQFIHGPGLKGNRQDLQIRVFQSH